MKRAGFRRGKGKSIVPAIIKNCQGIQEQILITDKAKKKKSSMKEKLRRISSQKVKSRRLQQNTRKAQKTNRIKEVPLNNNEIDLGDSEV